MSTETPTTTNLAATMRALREHLQTMSTESPTTRDLAALARALKEHFA